MANINLYIVPSGLRIVTSNSDLIYNEYSTKRNDLSKNEISIVSDIKDSYAEIKINFSQDTVFLDGVQITTAEDLQDSINNANVITSGIVDAGNSTSTPLNADAVFTGTAIDASGYGIIYVSLISDVSSATDGLEIQQSSDGINWDFKDNFTFSAGSAKTFSFQAALKYIRIKYTNGDTGQTYFRLQTVLKKGYGKPSSHRIQDSIADDDDAELVKAVLTGKNNGSFVNVRTSIDGDLRIVDNSSGLSIAKGNITGSSFIHKFGKAPDFDSTDGYVAIWDGANDSGVNLMQYTYSSSADIDTISSDSASDTFDLEIQGLDSDYNLVTQTKTLTGQTPVILDTSLIRVFRLKNVGSADNVGRIFCFKNVATTGGVPDTLVNIRAIIQPGNNQTLMAIYTIPAGKIGYMRDWYASLNNNVATSLNVELRARPFGQVFQVKHTRTINSTGTSSTKHDYFEPEVFSAKTDIVMQAQTAGNSVAASAGFDIVLIDD